MRAVILALLGMGVLLPATQDAALRDRVAQLVTKLGADAPADRDAAEKALVALGGKALPLLPPVGEKTDDADREARLARVRTGLEEASEKTLLEASRITIVGQGIRLSDALIELQKQSGNALTDMREQYGAEASNPALDLDIKDKPFFEALDTIAKLAGLGFDFQAGDGSIGLMPAGGMEAQQAIEPNEPKPTPLLQVVGPFRVELKQINSERNLATGRARCNAQFLVAWEPRLRPMLLTLKAENLEIVDDRGEKVAPEVMEESLTTVLRPESPSADVYLNMVAPARAAQSLKTIKLKADVTLPAGIRQFRFPKLDAQNATQVQGDVKLTLESTTVEENVWRVAVVLEMPGEGPAFESYQQGLFNNRLWLQKADGSRFEHNGGFSTTSVSPGKLGFEYLFVDAPGKPSDYAFVYETPSRVLTLPLEVVFENVPLP